MIQPKHVNIHDIINPINTPNVIQFNVIKTASGNIGRTDSHNINKQPNIGPYIPK